VSLIKISTLQINNYSRKGCQLYSIQVLDSTENNKMKIEDLLVLYGFIDVFPEEIPGLLPKREIEFSIELMLRVMPTSKVPYRMNPPELVELKIQLKEMLDKGYIRPSVSP
jgi:hypothetical protein